MINLKENIFEVNDIEEEIYSNDLNRPPYNPDCMNEKYSIKQTRAKILELMDSDEYRKLSSFDLHKLKICLQKTILNSDAYKNEDTR